MKNRIKSLYKSLRTARHQRTVSGGLAAAVMAMFTGFAIGPASAADSYPDRPLRLIIGFSAGGLTDIMGRAAAAEMSKNLGQPVIVENRTGAAGSVMADLTIAAAPDGYTMCLCGSGPLVLLPQIDKAAEKYPRQLSPVSLMYATDYILIGHSGLKANTIDELIADIKSRPGEYTYGSSGMGGIQHLGLAMLADTLGAPMVHVPYKGEQPAAIDVASGRIDLLLATPNTAEAMLKTGKVKAFASSGEQANELMPDIPTLKSIGLDNMLVHTFGGINVPRDTPPEVVARLGEAIGTAVRSEAFQARVRDGGMFVPALGATAYKDFLNTENARWSKVMERLDFQRQ